MSNLIDKLGHRLLDDCREDVLNIPVIKWGKNTLETGDIKIGCIKIPLYEMMTFFNGCFLGICKGLGLDLQIKAYISNGFLPTILAMSLNPLILKSRQIAGQKYLNETVENLNNNKLEIKTCNGSKKQLQDLNIEEKKFYLPRVNIQLKKLESLSKKPEYLNSTLEVGNIALAETMIGYEIGYFLSKKVFQFK